MTEREIEELADDEFAWTRNWNLLQESKGVEANPRDTIHKLGLKKQYFEPYKLGFKEGYLQALSNPDYILIEKRYIENRIKKLEEDLQVVIDNNDTNVIGANITVLAFDTARILSGITELKDILSNSKTK